MYLEDFQEFKETLKTFHETLRKGVEADSEYEGEADALLESMARVEEKIKTMDDMEQLKKALGQFGWDFMQVYLAIDELMAIDEEELDLEELDELNSAGLS